MHCFICYQDEKGEDGKNPQPLYKTKCACKNDNNICHKKCIETWIQESGQTNCGACSQKIIEKICFSNILKFISISNWDMSYWTILKAFFYVFIFVLCTFENITKDFIDSSNGLTEYLSRFIFYYVLYIIRIFLCFLYEFLPQFSWVYRILIQIYLFYWLINKEVSLVNNIFVKDLIMLEPI